MAEHVVARNHKVRFGPNREDVAYEGDTVPDLTDEQAAPLYANGVLESDEFVAQVLRARRLADGKSGVTAEEIDTEAETESIDPEERASAALSFGVGGGANASNPDLTPEVIGEHRAAAEEEDAEPATASRKRGKRTAKQRSTRSSGDQGQNAAQNEGTAKDPTSPGA